MRSARKINKFWLKIEYFFIKLKFNLKYKVKPRRTWNAHKQKFKFVLIPAVILIPTILVAAIIPKNIADNPPDTNISEEISGVIVPTNEVETEHGDVVSTSQIADIEELVIPQYKPKEEKLVLTFKKHSVQKGESIWSIAKKYSLSVDTLISANRKKLNGSESINIGDVIVVPSLDGVFHTVKLGDTIESVALKYDADIAKMKKINTLTSSVLKADIDIFIPDGRLSMSERRDILGLNFVRPVMGSVTSKYGFRKHPFTKKFSFHSGLDIGKNSGKKIVAAQSGKVIYAAKKGNYGKFIAIRHTGGLVTRYAHLSRISVKYGEYVKKGEVIGRVGSTGRSTGPHLHFEVKLNGKFVNPNTYVRF